MEDIEIINEYCQERNLKPETVKLKKNVLKNYTKSQNMNLEELLDEADMEEEQGIRMKRRKIKRRLQNFKQYLIDKNLAPRTINTNICNVKSFYRHYEIEVPDTIDVKMVKYT